MSDPFSTFLNVSGAIHGDATAGRANQFSVTHGSGAYSAHDRVALLELLRHLATEAERLAPDIAGMDVFHDAVRSMEEELGNDFPDRGRLTMALDRVQAVVAPVPPLTAIAAAISAVIAELRS